MLARPAVPVPASALIHHNAVFAKQAWRYGLRPDRREADQLRVVEFDCPLLSRNYVQVRCGGTVASASVSCDLVEPSPYKPKHGFFDIRARQVLNEKDPLEQPREVKQLGMFLSRLLTGSVLDTEGLCVLPGRRVWAVAVEVVVMNDEGNIRDVAEWAVMAALQHVRRPELTIRGDEVVIHPPHERDPVPLSLHHIPLSFTFAVCTDPQALQLKARSTALQRRGGAPSHGGSSAAAAPDKEEEVVEWSNDALTVVVDPTTEEMAAAACTICIAVNGEGQMCAMEKGEGCDVQLPVLQECMAKAHLLSAALMAQMKESLLAHEAKRKDVLRSQFLWAQQRSGIQAIVPPSPAETPADTDHPETKRSKTETS